MKSIINELWHGNIVPQEDSRNNTKEMKELISYIARHDEVPIKPLIALLYRPSHRATEPLLPSGRCREATEGIKLLNVISFTSLIAKSRSLVTSAFDYFFANFSHPCAPAFFQKCDRVSGNWIYATTNGKTRPITVTTISGILNLKPLL